MTVRTAPIALLLLFAATTGQADVARSAEWNFNVFLNDKLVGEHMFRVSPTATGEVLETEARFDVKFLFVTAYKYRHVSQEQWSDGCLRQVEARTNANGEKLHVVGQALDDGFQLSEPDASKLSPQCVKSFAYWNPDFLDAKQLLNTQTGEYTDFTITSKRDDIIEVRGSDVPAIRYALRAKGLELELWYSPAGDWLALESVLKNGRTLRYELAG